jgi:hypothetical protein
MLIVCDKLGYDDRRLFVSFHLPYVMIANAFIQKLVWWPSLMRVHLLKLVEGYHIIFHYMLIKYSLTTIKNVLVDKISCMRVTSFGNLKFVGICLSCHMYKHPCKWYWICKLHYSSFITLDQYAKFLSLNKFLVELRQKVYPYKVRLWPLFLHEYTAKYKLFSSRYFD